MGGGDPPASVAMVSRTQKLEGKCKQKVVGGVRGGRRAGKNNIALLSPDCQEK